MAEDLIKNAQSLINRLKELDSISTDLLMEVEKMHGYSANLLKYQEDLTICNKSSSEASDAENLNEVQLKNEFRSKVIKENLKLKDELMLYERTMNFIVGKSRDNTSNAILKKNIQFNDGYNEHMFQIVMKQRETIDEMFSILRQVASMDELAETNESEKFKQLEKENKIMRELVRIAKVYNVVMPLQYYQSYSSSEKATQTDKATIDAEFEDFVAKNLFDSDTKETERSNTSTIFTSALPTYRTKSNQLNFFTASDSDC